MSVGQVFALAVQHHQARHLPEAEACCKKILVAEPGHANALHLLGIIAYQRKDYDSCISLIQRSLSFNPQNAQALNSLGTVIKAKGNVGKALEYFQQALTLKPDYPEAHNNYGNTLRAQGKLREAIASLKTAISLNPKLVEAHYNLAMGYHSQGKLDMAVKSYKQVLSHKENSPEVYFSLGNVFFDQGNMIEAIQSFKKVISYMPNNAIAHNKLGTAYHSQEKLEEAIECYKRAISLIPNFVQPRNNMGCALCERGELEAAAISLKHALKLKPDYADGHCNLGNVLKEQGKYAEAISSYRKTIELNPNYTDVHSNLLLSLHYSTSYNSKSIFDEHIAWANTLKINSENKPDFENKKDSEKRLKIGYISPDFRSHSIAYFFEPIISHHNGKICEIYCYSAVLKSDKTTMRLRRMSHHWKSVIGLSTDQIVALIKNDEIDILIDLTGHTGKNYLSVFAHKPAPIQVTYLGYPNTTGLPTMDYRLTDDYADPSGKTEKLHTEKLIRLSSTAWCYRPPKKMPEVKEYPAKAKGIVTFGSFNASYKLNDKVYELWAKILSRVKDSRLLLKSTNFADEGLKTQITEKFLKQGIERDRIILQGKVASHKAHMGYYHKIDIALDSFPYHGTTTTCEALYMGVPVVSLEGEDHRSRVGVSLLNQVKLQRLIAKTEEEYIEIACSLASDLEALGKLRKGLRPCMEKSPLMDETKFTHGLEKAYREMWQKWCNG